MLIRGHHTYVFSVFHEESLHLVEFSSPYSSRLGWQDPSWQAFCMQVYLDSELDLVLLFAKPSR